MAKKTVTINLTPKQRDALRAFTGEDHAAVVFEGTKKALSAKLSPKRSVPTVVNRSLRDIAGSGSQLGSQTFSRVSARRATRGLIKK